MPKPFLPETRWSPKNNGVWEAMLLNVADVLLLGHGIVKPPGICKPGNLS